MLRQVAEGATLRKLASYTSVKARESVGGESATVPYAGEGFSAAHLKSRLCTGNLPWLSQVSLKCL